MLDPMRLARPGGDETQLLLGSAGFAGRMLRPRRRVAGIALRIGADIFVRNLRVGGRHGVAARIGRGVGIALVRRVRVGDIQTGRGGAGPRLLVMPVLLGQGFRPAILEAVALVEQMLRRIGGSTGAVVAGCLGHASLLWWR